MADPAPDASLCVACGYRDSIDGDFCGPCREKRAVEDYLAADAPVINRRQKDWGAWTSSAEAARERQRRHRLLANTRPRERTPRSADPLEIANEALEHLKRVKYAIKSNPLSLGHLDDACELVKQLAWGPAAPKVPGGRIGMHNRWHVKGGKPCNCPPALRSRTAP